MDAASRRLIVPFLHAVKAGGSGHASEAARLLERLCPRKQRAPKALPVGVKNTRPARRAAKKAETKALREAVFQRADHECELCPPIMRHPATEMHHLDSGTTRLNDQGIHNCMALCAWCHRTYHSNPEDFRAVVADWCRTHGYPLPRRFTKEVHAPLSASKARIGG